MSRIDPIDLAAQEEIELARKAKLEIIQRFESEDFKWLMSDKRGRRIVWRLLEKTGLYRSSFTGNSETFFREGERNIGLSLIGLVHEHSPEKYNLMVSEQKEYDRQLADASRRK